jgi:hypothetical protein
MPRAPKSADGEAGGARQARLMVFWGAADSDPGVDALENKD